MRFVTMDSCELMPGFVPFKTGRTVPKVSRQANSEFSELEESIGYMVRNAHRAYDRVLGTALSEHGVLTGHWSLLRVLWHEDGLTQIEVAKRMRIERASLTLMLNLVEKVGLITREIDEQDRRKHRIKLTRKGRALQPLLLPIGSSVNKVALRGLSEREVSTLRALLRRVINNLEQDPG